MAKEIARRGDSEIARKSNALSHQKHKDAAKKHAKKSAGHAAKHAAKKHAAKKHAKKAAKHVADVDTRLNRTGAERDDLAAAFHHMQRASVVISLMEKGTGEDLRDLLERGVKLYEKALQNEAEDKKARRAVGVLRAAEHLALAGLYAARHKHRQKATPYGQNWLKELIANTDHRLDQLKGLERGKGPDLYPVSVELLRQAEDADHDAHLASELAMAAAALCLALENGL